MTMRVLKPAPGRTVPQADGQPWPEAGLAVDPDESRYIRNRLRDGDLVEVAAPGPIDADDAAPAKKKS